jgi:hypothetical protein
MVDDPAYLDTPAETLSVYGGEESIPKPPKPPWTTADEAPGTVLLSTYTPTTAFSDPSMVNISAALSVYYGVESTSMTPKPPWMLASQLSTFAIIDRSESCREAPVFLPPKDFFLANIGSLGSVVTPSVDMIWPRSSSVDGTADVTEGLTLGVRTRDHCGCAHAVTTGGGTPRTTSRVD